MSEAEDPRVKRWNDVQPPQPSWTIAADYCRACGVQQTEERGDFYYDLYKAVSEPNWKRFYGTLAKIFHDAASDQREMQAIRQRRAEYGGDVQGNGNVPDHVSERPDTPASSPKEAA